ncbi:hypothetical protein B0H13DRAFT_1852241 [Mycena leptocephala]|nr:hypothetical protein B0H13DRAFT_1852241 [Mycena leptocephala]
MAWDNSHLKSKFIFSEIMGMSKFEVICAGHHQVMESIGQVRETVVKEFSGFSSMDMHYTQNLLYGRFTWGTYSVTWISYSGIHAFKSGEYGPGGLSHTFQWLYGQCMQSPPRLTARKYVPDAGSMLRGIWRQFDDLDGVDIWVGFKVRTFSGEFPGETMAHIL